MDDVWRQCLFEVCVRTAPNEGTDGVYSVFTAHVLTFSHPGRVLGMQSGVIMNSQLSASSVNETALAEWSISNARCESV
jgi:hypothetical protein